MKYAILALSLLLVACGSPDDGAPITFPVSAEGFCGGAVFDPHPLFCDDFASALVDYYGIDYSDLKICSNDPSVCDNQFTLEKYIQDHVLD